MRTTTKTRGDQSAITTIATCTSKDGRPRKAVFHARSTQHGLVLFRLFRYSMITTLASKTTQQPRRLSSSR